MRSPRRVLLFVVLAVGATYGALAWHFSTEIIAFGVRTPEAILAEDGLGGFGDVGLPAPEEVRFRSGDATLAAWLFRNPAPAACGVVLHHGHTGRRHGMLKYAPVFWPRGCHLLLIDARHHGASEGAVFTWGFREKHDLLRAVDALGAATGLERHQIGLFGESLGAAVSLQAAALAPDLAFVGADSTFEDLRSIVAKRGADLYGRPVLALLPAALALAGWRAGFDPSAVSPLRAAPSIRIPALLVHARDDTFIPASHSIHVFEKLPGPRKELRILDWGTDHGRSVIEYRERYRALVDDFLAREVPGFGRDVVLRPASAR